MVKVIINNTVKTAKSSSVAGVIEELGFSDDTVLVIDSSGNILTKDKLLKDDETIKLFEVASHG